MNYKEILSSINRKDFKTVYFLMGDESYYIDNLIKIFSDKILNEDEKIFNQTILYGKETNVEQIISEAKQFPINAEKRVVIVKEAQNIRNIEKIESYFKNPQKNSILVFGYKNKKIDKRKKFGKELNKNCVVFESKKLYENQIPTWINEFLQNKGYKTNRKTTMLLAEYLGTDLSKIINELNKIILAVTKEQIINTEIIQKYIGISKDYNIFELQVSLGERDLEKISLIINYFGSNQKNHHIILIINHLFSFFRKILIYKYTNDKSPNNIAKHLKINPFFVKQYQNAAGNYSKKQLFHIFELLKEYDLKSKGVKNKNTNEKELLKELLLKIIYV